MRTLILVVFAVFALSMGYLAYWWMQTPPAARQKAKAGEDKPLAFKTFGHESKYGEGENIWIKKYNEETTKLASRFKADEYKPRNDGWIVVKQPRAQFFMNDGRAIFIEGDTGEIITDDNRTSGKALAGSRDTPSRGRLYNVTIRLFNNIFDPENQMDEAYLKSEDDDRPKPAMTITLNNASFDNQTFKIYSEAYGRGKGRIAADQVPVTLRGDDYDFDGKGLVIRWNERDRRLQLLEVAHGETLTIKHPSTFMQKEEPTVVLDDSQRIHLEGPLPAMLAAKGHHAAGEAIANQPKPTVPRPTSRRSRGNVPKPKITPNTDPPLYRAIFHDDVKIVQGQDLTATANRMSIDFLMQDQEKQNNSPQPATRPAGHSGKSAKSGATTQPSAAHGDSSGVPAVAKTPKATVAQASPTTRPAAPAVSESRRKRKSEGEDEVPVVITWTGKLVVEPLSVGTENPIKNGDAVVRLEGTPVVAQQQGSTIYAGTLTYRTEDQAMLLTPVGAGRPVVMKDTKGSVVETTRLDFFQPKHQAILYGASNASFPQMDESGKPGAPLLAKWTKTCTLYFSGGELASNGSMNIERAELDGNVDVTHPQVKIKSDALDLSFDTNKPAKSTTQPTTQTITTVVENDQSKLLALKSTVAQVDARLEKLLVPFGTSNIDPLVQSRMAQVEKLETALAQQNKAIKDRVETGQSTPRALLDQVAQAQKEYETAKAGFDLLQQAALEIQDLRGEHTRLARQVADLQKQFASAKPAARATTQATTRPAVRTDLKQLVATGSVHCEMTDSAKKTQTIDCSRLTLQTSTTPDGKIYPNTVNADGDVHAVDPDQDLRAAHLAVVLRPTTQPSKAAGSGDTANAELQSLIAHKDVVVISKDGTRTMADDLLIDNKDGKNNVKLLGQPYARVIDKKNTLSGPIIEIFPDVQQLQVVGAGNMKGVQQEKAGDPERPINVTWDRGMTFDGKTNIVDITGNVVAVSKDAEGATNTASGQHVKMLLADAAPTTRPTTQAAAQPTTRPVEMALATTHPTSQPTSRPSRSGQYGAMASKTVRQINFENDAKVNSVTLADDGSLLRRTHLEAALIEYDLLLKKLVIPVEGRMIVEDHRPTTQPSGASEPRPASAKVDNNAENNRGTTAFHWPKQFTFDNATHQAVMLGTEREQVVVVHKDDSPKAQTFRLTGDVVTAELEEVATTQPTTKPANATVGQATTKPVAPATKTQLRRVTANGNLLFTGPGAEVHAIYMEYDPHTHWLIARGNENAPVDFSIATQPIGSRRAEELHYNLETGEVQSTKMNIRMGR